MIPRLSGTLVVDQLALIRKQWGTAAVDASIDRLTEEQQEEIRAATPVSWLSVATFTQLKNEIAHELGIDPLEFQRQVVRSSIGDTIKKFWRLLLRQLWDAAIVKRTPILYKKAFDRGEMRLDSIAAGRATFILSGWPDIPEYDCVGLATGMEALLEYSGRPRAAVRFRRRAPHVVFEASWTPKKSLFD